MATGGAPLRAVVGAGAWGTTLALRLARSGPVTLLARDAEVAREMRADGENRRHLPGVALPVEVEVSADEGRLSAARELVVMAVPSAHLRASAIRIASVIRPEAVVLSVVKGLEARSLARMTEVLAAELPVLPERLAALSGPNLAPEIARGLPAAAVVASVDGVAAAEVIGMLGGRSFRLYRSMDVVGVELAGALKNVVAIAAGAVDALALGDNAKAAIVTRGLAEITRLGIAAGASPATFAGLAGMGDILATCASPLSRNHRLGMAVAQGRPWAEVEAGFRGVAEGAHTVTAALALAQRLDVELPLAAVVHAVLFEGLSVADAMTALLARDPRDEVVDG